MTISAPIKKISTESEIDACNITYSDEFYTARKFFTIDPELTEEIAICNSQCAFIPKEPMPIVVEEGTVFTNASATWKHEATKNNKKLKLFINGKYHGATIDIIPKSERSIMSPVGATDQKYTGNFIINPILYRLQSTIVLPDTFSCVPVPFHGYDIHIHVRGNPVTATHENEKTALQTFREMVTEKEYRKYLRYGFINIKAASGKIYQICRENAHVKVWKSGLLLEEICVRISNQRIPPTDRVIALMIMIETDEKAFRNLGNIYKIRKAA